MEEPKQKKKKNDFPSVVQPMLTVKSGCCSRPKSGGGYEKAPRRREPIFLPALLSLLLVSFSFSIYNTGMSLFKSVVRFPELMVRNGGPEEIKNIYI